MKRMILLAIMAALAMPAQAGLGIARDHISGSIIALQPGESTWYGMRIQNNGDKNITILVQVTGGEGTVTLPKTTYLVPASSYNTEVRLNVSMPEDAVRGRTYSAKITIGQAGESGGGQVAMTGAVSFNLTVKVAGALEVSTFIPRQNLSEQTFPCIEDKDCPIGYACSKQERICRTLPSTTTTLIAPQQEKEDKGWLILPVLFLSFIASVLMLSPAADGIRQKILYQADDLKNRISDLYWRLRED